MSSQYLDIEILLIGAILMVVGVILKLLPKQKKHNIDPKLSLSSILASIGIAAIVMYVLIWLDNDPWYDLNTESIIKEYKTTHKINCL